MAKTQMQSKVQHLTIGPVSLTVIAILANVYACGGRMSGLEESSRIEAANAGGSLQIGAQSHAAGGLTDAIGGASPVAPPADAGSGGRGASIMRWTQVEPDPSYEWSNQICGRSAADVWINLQGRMLNWNGSNWSTVEYQAPGPIHGYYCGGVCDIWLVGAYISGPYIYHWGCDDYTLQTPDFHPEAVWGAGANDVWVVGSGGKVSHWDGVAWNSAVPVDGAEFYLVWGAASDDVWVAGERGILIHFNGVSWSSHNIGTVSSPRAIWGSSATDVWVVGSDTLHHWNGTVWSSVESVTTASLFGIWGSREDDVWVVGEFGTILHWDGTDWLPSPSGTSEDLYGIWGSSSEDIWIVGNRTVLRGQP